ncbi:phenylalanine--tRNA ligase subunit beta [Advenella mimigardefordensis]|uniref:Phenylalanine--tRNA ligase beta subunit n=1 Tax=Advenella mimigardefordensis (strain DSM 17166 / LMG 22922 / DPN7) TaxID=1247726 RepID=W0PBM9_ADVMD|nr:phenylalanine--tRNA ligase subunit beta [Advenella mimigardefordensis]AHG64259.1 phenylalanine--tRNA ligase beta subunit [Advenella mimigardefordensis DPN7]
MLFPESWLRSFVNPSISTDELSHTLTMAGLEIEGTAPVAPPFSGIVVAHIMAVRPHPNADKLRICTVDDGSGEPLQIVCGAPNAAEGLKVPLARIGAVLPGDFKISKARMRGEDSFGMLCSARELGLSQDHGGLLELDANAKIGQDIRSALDLNDTIFEIKLTPNRADCLSILGVAREVRALTGASLTEPVCAPVAVTHQDVLPVTVDAPDLCGRFAGRIIRGVNARAATPDWMKSRLERAGQRSVSALVDISNYVMLELGRPSHVFDLTRINGGLTVRWAKEGESLTLLNDQTVQLAPDVGVIAAGETIESLAGIMGGAATAVSLDTTDIYLEAAFWFPDAIAGRARRYKFSSEASHRFERGVDFQNVVEHIEYISSLILEICGGQAGPVSDQTIALPPRPAVSMRLARCRKVLGVNVTEEQVRDVFTKLNFQFTEQDGVFSVIPPSFRFDLEIEEDLIEEVARIYGFENIPSIPPKTSATMLSTNETRRSQHQLRHLMAALDYQEVVNFSFVQKDWESNYMGNSDPIVLLNPIASQLEVMRSGLIGGLIANIQYNQKRQQSRVRVFELGRIFVRDSAVTDGDLSVAGVRQPLHLAGAAWGPAEPEQWGLPVRQTDFFDVKNDIERLCSQQLQHLRFEPVSHPALHPGRSASILLNGELIGFVGELHPQWVQDNELVHAPVVFEMDVAALQKMRFAHYTEVAKQPAVFRDLAIWAPVTVKLQDLLDTLENNQQDGQFLDIIKDIALFDVWKDPQSAQQERSLALRFTLQDPVATLEDTRVDQCMNAVLELLVQKHGVRKR